MIFGRVCEICDDFGDYHDEIVVTSIDFIGRRPICSHYLQGEGSFWEPPTKTTTPGQRSHRRWPRRGNQVMKVINLHPMLYLMMQPPIFFQRFICVLDWFRNVGSCGMSNVSGLVIGFGIRTALWLRHSMKVFGEEDDGRIWIDYYVSCISDFFMCNLGMYFVKI
ncbi:hypothetical protein PVAP13_8NG220204 [Panicum virgatum]|uniref:Uncharacterized protein n=1 Tax=Panicum virgatum TaxID=38727 RepID=A0A8T0PBT3_PANVG|nr:hypothetical protein PVAP13_8NG220204 [Panicum virgatum]